MSNRSPFELLDALLGPHQGRVYLHGVHMRLRRQLAPHRRTYPLRSTTHSPLTLRLQPNGANLTGGGTGSGPLSASATASSSPYVPFNGQGSGAETLKFVLSTAAPTVLLGALVAVAGIFATL